MRSSVPTTLLILGFTLVLGSCTGGAGGAESPTSPLAIQLAGVEFDSFGYLNSTRDEHAVQPQLDLREKIAQVARLHSEYLRDSGLMVHEDSRGGHVADRLREAGIQFSAAAENLAQVENTGNPAAYAHQLLMESEPHRRNILDERFELVGVGVARQGGRYWITQVFVDR